MVIQTDGDLTDEQAKIAASLSPELIEKIDECILSHATSTARLIFGQLAFEFRTRINH